MENNLKSQGRLSKVYICIIFKKILKIKINTKKRMEKDFFYLDKHCGKVV